MRPCVLVIIGAALIPKVEPNKTFSSFKEKLFSKLSLSGVVVKKEGDLIYGPISRKGVCLGDGKVLIAGEAASLVSPLAGDGITSALMSGYFLGSSFGKPDVKKEYKRKVGEIINRVTKDIFLYNILRDKETRLRLFTALKAEERKEEEKRRGMKRLALSKVGVTTLIRCSMKAWGL